jgi:hypothetical protein
MKLVLALEHLTGFLTLLKLTEYRCEGLGEGVDWVLDSAPLHRSKPPDATRPPLVLTEQLLRLYVRGEPPPCETTALSCVPHAMEHVHGGISTPADFLDARLRPRR